VNKGLQPTKLFLGVMLVPGALIFTISCIAPLAVAVYYSLFDWNGGIKMTFRGLLNYRELLFDKAFWGAFKNNLLFIFWTVLGQIGLAFIVSMLLISRSLKLKNLHRTVIFFPAILSAVVVGFLWRIIYNKDYGLVNLFLTTIGRGDWIRLWLDDPKIVINSLAIPKIWQFIGYYMVILLAAIQSIDKSILEVAELDGATGWRKSLFIVLPLIKNTLLVTIMLCISGNMKTFDQIYVMTGGGPGTSSQVVAMYAYNISVNRMRYGYGSAAAIGILILSLILIFLSRLVGKKQED
jgi:raffinose/stachyose/melibiose transport system permease protein